MVFCNTCGTLMRLVPTGRGKEHRCPDCDDLPPEGQGGQASKTPSRKRGTFKTDGASTSSSTTGGSGTTSVVEGTYTGPEKPEISGARSGSAPEGAGRFFPFPEMRPGQERFVKDVRSALKGGDVLVAQVPTGVGKTAGVLAPALEVAARSRSKIFFLTSKQSQHKVAVDTLKLTEQVSGTDLVVSDMISKQAMCPRPESEQMGARQFGEFCQTAMMEGTCRYYENDDEPVFRALGNEIHHVEEAVQLSAQETVCPYKALTEVAQIANVVVLDYNHFFSDLLDVTLDRFQVDLDDAILIIDEAHNLPDRIRSHLTWRMTSRLLDDAASEARTHGAHPASKFCQLLAEQIDQTFHGRSETEVDPETLTTPIEELLTKTFRLAQPDLHEVLDELEDVAEAVLKEESVSACEDVVQFLTRWPTRRTVPERSVLRRWDPEIEALTYQILDATFLSRRIFEQVHGAVLMSGTLYPMEMYSKILGVPDDRAVHERYPNPFPEENRRVVVDPTVSSKMSDRGPQMYQRIATTIAETAEVTPGNVAAFFPSYSFMEEIADALPRTGRRLLVEERRFDKERKEQMVTDLRQAGGNAILMGVQGGSLSEGYDFVEDGDNLLESVLVVGVPYAAPTLEVKSLRSFFDEAFGQGAGWKYGYLAPAMQRTLQAAGRAVRAPDHRAFVALLDRRFTQGQVKRWLPPDMNPRPVQDVAEAASRFFR